MTATHTYIGVSSVIARRSVSTVLQAISNKRTCANHATCLECWGQDATNIACLLRVPIPTSLFAIKQLQVFRHKILQRHYLASASLQPIRLGRRCPGMRVTQAALHQILSTTQRMCHKRISGTARHEQQCCCSW